MASAWQAAAAVRTAGRAPVVTRGRVTRAAANTAPARTASANAALAGTENTALSVGCVRGRESVREWLRVELFSRGGFGGAGFWGEKREKHA